MPEIFDRADPDAARESVPLTDAESTALAALLQAARIGRAGRLRAGLTLVPRGELAVALGILAAVSAPGRGPGAGLAALAAVLVIVSAVAPSLVPDARRPGWYRWAVPTSAAVRPDPSGAG